MVQENNGCIYFEEKGVQRPIMRDDNGLPQ